MSAERSVSSRPDLFHRDLRAIQRHAREVLIPGACRHDGFLSSSHSRRKAELRCMKCGKVWRHRG